MRFIKKISNNFWKNIFITLILAVSFFGATQVRAATFYFDQTPKSVSIGDNFKVTVYVDTQSDSINLAEGVIHFPVGALSVISVDNSDSDFNIWPEAPSFSNSDGTINFSGGIVSPGYSGSSGKVFSFTAKAKKSGGALMSFSDVSIRANDGSGTNVVDTSSNLNSNYVAQNNNQSQDQNTNTVSTSTADIPNVINPTFPSILENASVPNLFSSTIKISSPKKTLPENVAQATGPVILPGTDINSVAPTIVSSTHPNQNVWYNNNYIDVSWSKESKSKGTQVSFGQSKNATPSGLLLNTYKSQYNEVKDGVSYFSARNKYASGWSPVSTYIFHIDTQAPDFTRATSTVQSDGSTKIDMDALDILSGVDHFSVSVNGDPLINIKANDGVANYIMPPALYLGEYKVNLSVYDRAGNSKSIMLPVFVDKLSVPAFTAYSKNVIVGSSIYVSGNSSYANKKVLVFVQYPDQKLDQYLVDTDSSGNFRLQTEPVTFAGNYKIWSQFSNDRGEKSYESIHIGIESYPSIWMEIIDYIYMYRIIIISVILLISLLFILIFYFNIKISKSWK